MHAKSMLFHINYRLDKDHVYRMTDGFLNHILSSFKCFSKVKYNLNLFICDNDLGFILMLYWKPKQKLLLEFSCHFHHNLLDTH